MEYLKIKYLICLRSLLQERITGLARGYTKIKSWSLVVNDAQKLNNILYSFEKMVKLVPQHAEMEQNCERLIVKIQHC